MQKNSPFLPGTPPLCKYAFLLTFAPEKIGKIPEDSDFQS